MEVIQLLRATKASWWSTQVHSELWRNASCKTNTPKVYKIIYMNIHSCRHALITSFFLDSLTSNIYLLLQCSENVVFAAKFSLQYVDHCSPTMITQFVFYTFSSHFTLTTYFPFPPCFTCLSGTDWWSPVREGCLSILIISNALKPLANLFTWEALSPPVFFTLKLVCWQIQFGKNSFPLK